MTGFVYVIMSCISVGLLLLSLFECKHRILPSSGIEGYFLVQLFGPNRDVVLAAPCTSLHTVVLLLSNYHSYCTTVLEVLSEMSVV